MTTVHIAPAATNPTAEYVAFQRYSGAALFGERIRAYLVDGEATVALESTVGRAWRWRAQEIGWKDVVTRHVAVQNVTGTVEYDDLEDVDPETLQPEDAPEAAWWQALEGVQAGAIPNGSVTLNKLGSDVIAELDAQGPAGPGVAVGGAPGQVLAKNSTANYDTEWIDPPTGGGSGPSPADAAPADIGTAAVGTSEDYARENHVHAIPAGHVTNAMLAGSIAGSKLASSAIGATQLGTGAVTTSKLGDAAVTTAKIGDDQVTVAKLATDVETALAKPSTVKAWNGTSYVDAPGAVVYVGGTTDPTVNDGDIWIEV